MKVNYLHEYMLTELKALKKIAKTQPELKKMQSLLDYAIKDLKDSKPHSLEHQSL